MEVEVFVLMLRLSCLLLFTLISLSPCIYASADSKLANDDLGWTSSMDFEGNIDSSQRVLDLTSTVGYNFSKHWGIDAGVPFEFVSTSGTGATTGGVGTGKGSSSSTTSSTPTGSSSLNSIGNAFADLRFEAKNQVVNYRSSLMGTAPTGSHTNGISTGRANLTWNNHVEREFGLVTPFLEAGLSNGISGSRLYLRPFTSLGFVSQFSGGTNVDLGHDFSVGASLYDVLPSGQQKLFSSLVSRGNGHAAGSGNHGRAYELNAETVGTSALTRDNGNSAWIEYAPGALDFQFGYTHSVHYALNTIAFSLNVNLRHLLKSSPTH
jgi:hypothetical protein